MFTKVLKVIILSLALVFGAHARESLGERTPLDKSSLKRKINDLVDNKLYFSSIPYLKEYISKYLRYRSDRNIEKALETVLTNTGVKQFEILSTTVLKRSESQTLKYVVAKKLVKKKPKESIKYSSSINSNHPIYPFALHTLAVGYANVEKNNLALKHFRDCLESSRIAINNLSSNESSYGLKRRQLKQNLEYCQLGMARVNFALKNFQLSSLQYLDIPKSSRIWPEILLEEAWVSYYLKNYNRTLGKLVTYKAPVLDFMFNPEVNVLRALTYLKMCLYNDAKSVADNFYNQYLEEARNLRNLLRSKRNNYSYFYKLIANYEQKVLRGGGLIELILKKISKESAYLELKDSYVRASYEYGQLDTVRRRERKVLKQNVNEVIKTQRKIIGAFVRNAMLDKYGELYSGFEGMSYIKLEVLQQRKKKLYEFQSQNKKRGDLKYIKKNEKQYFWSFNGEFWADELGDYVFALRSEC